MKKLSVIILSYAIDDEVYQTNLRALNSLLESEQWPNNTLDIVLVESNRDATYQYDLSEYQGLKYHFQILCPNEPFNFHRFFNIGLSHTTGEYIAFCNNDIIFEQGWYSEIMKVKASHPEFMCFSPIDPSYPLMATLPQNKDLCIGWENKEHFAAWCFVWEREVFKTTGLFDERFNFYSADDDELQTLRYYAIPNVVVTHSVVRHLSQVVTKKMDKITSPIIPESVRERYPLTKEEIRRGYTWLWEDVRFYDAYQKFKYKWGNNRMIKRVNRFFAKYPFMNRPCITKLLYNKSVNICLAKITGIKF